MICGGLRTKGITKTGTADHPLITVVTVVFNGEKTLEQAIQSVVNQTYDNVEYIIIDGNSSDRTLDIIKKYEDKIDYWQSEPDKGIYDAMNKGIGLATGEYIALLNADDWYELKTVELVVSNLNSNSDIYYGMMRVLSEEYKLMWIYGYTTEVLDKFMIAHPTCFVRSILYKKYQYDTNYKSAADYDLFLTFWQNKYQFKFIEKILGNYLLGGMSDSLKGRKETSIVKYKHRVISKMNYFFHLFFYCIRGWCLK